MLSNVHPFPARMAPELALQALANVPPEGLVVDPMVGSGTVVRQASSMGRYAKGFDMDPLAVLMSKVWTTPVDDEAIEKVFTRALSLALAADPSGVDLPWIDQDEETTSFVNYWFAPQQRDALRCWAHAFRSIEQDADGAEAAALDVLRISMSRIIITKEQCASLARDTSHSRPHKVATDNFYCVHSGIDKSLKTIRRRLIAAPPSPGVTIQQGDARRMPLSDAIADAVLTSPPYLNAIDYMRGHRLSLVWLGYSLRNLRAIRSSSIGAERAPDHGAVVEAAVKAALGELDGLPRRHTAMVNRYVADLVGMASEIRRILKPGGTATLVVGNSCLKGVFIKNSSAVAKALELAGLRFKGETVRELPTASRYLPTSIGSSLANRMRQETVLTLVA